MANPYKTVAILVASPALAELLRVELAGAPQLRVRVFDSPLALEIYMRIAPVDLLLVDFDHDEAPADMIVATLRADGWLDSPDFRALALTAALSPELSHRGHAAGIAEIIVKPASPRHVRDRAVTLLARPAAPQPARQVPPAQRPVPRSQHNPQYIDFSLYPNVVPLWTKDRPLPQH